MTFAQRSIDRYGGPLLQPNREIIRTASEIQPDLLIMGAHGGLKDPIFGTTIDSVRHKLRIPLLVVRVAEIINTKSTRMLFLLLPLQFSSSRALAAISISESGGAFEITTTRTLCFPSVIETSDITPSMCKKTLPALRQYTA